MTLGPQGAGAAKLAGKYVAIWKREDGGWKTHVDSWKGDQQA